MSKVKVLHLFERILCCFSSSQQDPRVVLCSAKSFSLEIPMVSSQDASDLLRVLKQTETSIVQECAICHRRLEPAKCFKCEFCGLFVCERCQGTTSEVAPLAGSDAANRPADAAASESRPKSKPASKLLLCRACAPSLDASSSQKPTNPSIHPMFPKIVQDPYDPNSFLPAGWGIAMLPDGRRYFFNPLLWLSSWAIPKEEWSNDCPVGFAKYFDQNGEAFVFDAKLGKAVGNAEGRVFVKKCPCCKYDCSDVKEMVCPACNSVIRSFLCVCAKTEKYCLGGYSKT